MIGHVTYCVEMTCDGGASWIPMHAHGSLGSLAGITRDDAVDRASRLLRRSGRYAYRVRRDR